MTNHGESLRMARLFAGSTNAVIVAIDHGLYFGPLPGLIDLPRAIQALDGADGILLGGGMVPHCASFFARRGAPSMIVRLNWATNYVAPWKYEHSHSVPILHVPDAQRLGADIVLSSLTLKTPDQAEDARNVELFAAYVQEKTLAQMPLVCEVYPIGGDFAAPEELQSQVEIGCRMAAELGADMIKTFFTGKDFAKIASATPIPIFVLGALKKPRERDALTVAAQAIGSGARGIVFGRNVVQAREPQRLLAALREVVKEGVAPDTAASRHKLE
jgi:DhnA family fructose-bisphosphate aldolase class Ia